MYYFGIVLGSFLGTFIVIFLRRLWVREQEIQKLPQKQKCELGREDLHDWQDVIEPGAFVDESIHDYSRKQVCSCCKRRSIVRISFGGFDFDSGVPAYDYFRQMIK